MKMFTTCPKHALFYVLTSMLTIPVILYYIFPFKFGDNLIEYYKVLILPVIIGNIIGLLLFNWFKRRTTS